MKRDEHSLLEFPCRFPIKIVGHASPDFETEILALIRRHAPELSDEAVSRRPSQGGKYLALTVTIEASSRQQLDAIYRALSAHEQVVMSL